MSVNKEYWSGSETTTIYDIDFELPLFQGATVSGYEYFDNSFVGKCKKGDINPQDDIDVSYSFCRTDSNFAPCKAKLLCGYSTSYNPASQRGKQYDVSLQGYDIGLGIKEAILRYSTRIQYTSTTPTTLKTTNIPNTNTENKKPLEAYANGNYYYDFSAINLAPVLKVNPRNFMMVIMVNCSKLKEDKSLSDYETEGSLIFNGSERCDLKTYIQHYAPLGYNIITGVWCLLKINPFDNRNVNSGKIGISAITADRYSLEYIGSDDDNYIFNAKLPIRGDIYTGTTFKYTTDNNSIEAGSFTWTGYSQQIIVGCLENSSPIYPYEFINIGLGDKFKLYKYNNTYLTATTISDFDNVENFREWCRKQSAYFGLPFRENRDFSNVDENLTDERIMWGIIENGVTHGEYTTGIGNILNPLYNSDNLQNDSGWIPYSPTPTGDDDIGNLTTILRHGTYTAGCNFYVMTSAQLNALTTFLNTGYQPSDEDFIKDFKGINPFEYITSVLYYPFDIPNIPDIQTIKVGALDTGLSTKKLITSYGIDNIYDFGNFNITPYFNDFRDFSPYTQITLQLPFCSSITLDTGLFMGHSVNVKMVVDYITGNCSCFVYRDELLMSVVNGTIGHSISLTLKSMSDFQNKLQNLSLQRQTNNRNTLFGVGASIGTIVGGVASANPLLITGGVGGLIKSADTYAQNKSATEYQSSHTVPNIGTTGANSPINDMVCELLPRIIITRPKSINSDMSQYGKTVGYACNKSGLLSDFDGLTVCTTAKLDEIEATETEKEMILNLLTSGVYL